MIKHNTKQQAPKQHKQNSPTPLSPTLSRLGGWTRLRKPAAAFLKWQRMSKGVQIDMKQEKQANDNAERSLHKSMIFSIRAMCLTVGVLSIAGFTGSSYTDSIQAAIAQGDDAVLEQAMTNDPDALAYALNAIVVGE